MAKPEAVNNVITVVNAITVFSWLIAMKPGVADKIVDISMNGSGVRDTSLVLGINTTTVIAHLKNSTYPQFRRSPSTK